jgi:hypothetical protein
LGRLAVGARRHVDRFHAWLFADIASATAPAKKAGSDTPVAAIIVTMTLSGANEQ